MTAFAVPPPARSEHRDIGMPGASVADRLRGAAPAPAERFDPARLAGLPEPARRWLSRAITPGTPLVAGMDLEMHGEIRLGRWRSFTAAQTIVAEHGFVWAAHTRLAGLPVSGYDSYTDGAGVMRWRVAGLVPVQSASGFDVSVSAFDRLVAETVLVPTALVGAHWAPGPDRDSAVYLQREPNRAHRARVTIRVEPDGRLSQLSMWRWGDPEGTETFRRRLFEVSFDAEFDACWMRIPAGIRASWRDASGQQGEFYRAVIDTAAPLPGS